MDILYAPYLRYGTKVKDGSGTVYTLVENMSADKDTVAGVDSDLYGRFQTLTAWVRNWKSGYVNFQHRTAEEVMAWDVELAALVVPLKISEVEPVDKIRFITSRYETKFYVPNLGMIRVNGEVRQVYAIDDYHFGMVGRDYSGKPDGKMHGASLYHICEFAEMCEAGNIKVEPVNDQSSP